MRRKKKTTYNVEGDYGHGFEILVTEFTRAEAIERMEEYKEADKYKSELKGIRVTKHYSYVIKR